MARLDVFRKREGAGYFLDCQADLLDHLNTRFVVPLVPAGQAPKPAARLNPLFEVEGTTCVMLTQLAAAVFVSDLGEAVTSLGHRDLDVTNALEMLLVGL